MAVHSYGRRFTSGDVSGADSISVNEYVRGTPKEDDTEPTPIEYRGMAPYGSATGDNRVPGNVWLTGLAPSNGGTTYGKAGFKLGATEFVWANYSGSERRLTFQSTAYIADNRAYFGLVIDAGGAGSNALKFMAGGGIEFADAAGGTFAAFRSGRMDIFTSRALGFYNATQTTVGAAGAAAPLPGAPAKYIKIAIDDEFYVIPAWAES